MQEGDIILTSLPQADGQLKNRPALLLRSMPPFGDFLVCGISSQLQQGVEDFDEIIQPSDVDFRDSGLKAPSLIRLGFLAVLPVRSFLGAIGSVAPARHHRLLRRLSEYLQRDSENRN